LNRKITSRAKNPGREVVLMDKCKTRELISILMESPLYQTLSMKEQDSLLARLSQSYPFLVEGEDDETELGYESSWRGINHQLH